MENLIVKQPKPKDLWRVKASLDETSVVVAVTGLEREILDPERVIVSYHYDVADRSETMYLDDFLNSFDFLDGPERHHCAICGTTEGLILQLQCVSCDDPTCEHETIKLCFAHLQQRIERTAVRAELRALNIHFREFDSPEELLKFLGIEDVPLDEEK